jgi:ABC-type bacteriocin/lantibiotic exporters, contain an N-terminal double-glycine peptidase domain
MDELRKIKDIYSKLNFIMSQEQKRLAVLVMMMSMVAALLELLGVAVIIPILDMLLNLEALSDKWFVQLFKGILGLDNNEKIVWFICIAIILVYLFKNLYFTFYNWVSLKFSYKVRRELSIRVLYAYMQQGYIFFVENNTSRLLQGISGDIDSVYSILNSTFNIITKALTIICISTFIVMQFPQMAIVLVILAVICLIIIQLVFQKAMLKNGAVRRSLLYENYKTSLEAIQGNKEILVMHKQNYFVSVYSKTLEKLYRVCVKVDLGTISPGYIIEMVCIAGIMLVVAIQMKSVDSNYTLLSQLSTVAVGAFRILPALGAITSGINIIMMNTSQLAAAYETLAGVKELENRNVKIELKENSHNKIKFKKELEVRNVYYKYPNAENYVIAGVDIKIQKGQSIAFIGASGAGKTTLSDIILSLLKPQEGAILMDGISIEELRERWSQIVGYVPQAVYIVDDTIEHNIAFGENSIDEKQVWQSLKAAQLDDFVEKLPMGIHTIVGERGVKFSGGQRQRLAIARALYRNPEILVLDEATAALDNETEEDVMKAIESLQGYKTMIIVAHRLTTIRNCDRIYEIKNGKAVERSKEEILDNILKT